MDKKKTPVTILQELCVQKSVVPQFEEVQDNKQGTHMFTIKVDALGKIAYGCGRSKKDAKHDAAATLLKKLNIAVRTCGTNIFPPRQPYDVSGIRDYVGSVKGYCLENDMPDVVFKLVQQYGPSDGPEFVIKCSLANIVRLGISSTIKKAKQIAAQAMFLVLMKTAPYDRDLNVALFDAAAADEVKMDHYSKMYLELKETKECSAKVISERHNYFQNKPAEKKASARLLLDNYDNDGEPSMERAKETVEGICLVLDLKYVEGDLDGFNTWELVARDFECFFYAKVDEIYFQIIDYMKIMIT